MKKFIDLNTYPVKNCLEKLLEDKTTGNNIIFATDDYVDIDAAATKESQITMDFLLRYGDKAIVPRFCKSTDHKSKRTKENAEVFTPVWICNKMINYLVDDWKNTNKEDVWQDFINTTFLEITCGEAPYLTSRYDSTTGHEINLPDRIGILDRKLALINKNAEDYATWFKWTLYAYKSTYAYEFSGDSLLIARINLLNTFCENLDYKFERVAKDKELEQICDVIVNNVVQMDGLKYTVPYKTHRSKQVQMSLFDNPVKDDEAPTDVVVYDHKNNKSILFRDIEKGREDMKFDYCIGNPPYQETRETTKDMPVYDKFMEESYKVSKVSELITPARFLFNAGATSKQWNKKILNDIHFKVLFYEQNSSKIFANTDIKGGVCISLYDKSRAFLSIGTFTPFDELNSIKDKVYNSDNFLSLSTIMYPYSTYTLSEEFWNEFPEKRKRVEYIRKNNIKPDNELSNLRIITTNIFDLMSDFFYSTKPDDGYDYCEILGRRNNDRCTMFIRSKYISTGKNYNKWKVIIPKSNGSGALGEVLSTPLIGKPLIGYTQSFLGIGSLNDKEPAENLLKYIKTKFARVLLGILKITQDNPPEKWKYVPLQDFSEASDIDWSKSIPEIDKQLNKKYGLDDKEIEFIESHVKEMK